MTKAHALATYSEFDVRGWGAVPGASDAATMSATFTGSGTKGIAACSITYRTS